MSVLIYTEFSEGKFKKVALELASYAKKIAESLGTTVTAVIVNAGDVSALGTYGVDKVLKVTDAKLDKFNAKAYADVVKQAAQKEGAKVVILSSTIDSLYMAPVGVVGFEAVYDTNVPVLTVSTNPFQVKRNAFSNKGFNITELTSDVKPIAIAKNSSALVQAFSPPAAQDLAVT